MEVLTGLRKIVTVIEDVYVEGGRDVRPPRRVAAVGAVLENFLVGEFVEDLAPLIDAYCEPLGRVLSPSSAARERFWACVGVKALLGGT